MGRGGREVPQTPHDASRETVYTKPTSTELPAATANISIHIFICVYNLFSGCGLMRGILNNAELNMSISVLFLLVHMARCV
jgi:hypothetical protein